jgi:hypothetical protein
MKLHCQPSIRHQQSLPKVSCQRDFPTLTLFTRLKFRPTAPQAIQSTRQIPLPEEKHSPPPPFHVPHRATIESRPKRGLTDSLAAGHRQRLLIIGRASDHVRMWLDISYYACTFHAPDAGPGVISLKIPSTASARLVESSPCRLEETFNRGNHRSHHCAARAP